MSLTPMLDRVFGRLVVVDVAGISGWGDRIWLCLCECGAQTRVRGCNLRSGMTRSCGCLARELSTLPAHVIEAGKANRLQRWEQEQRGRRFGRLTPLQRVVRDRRAYWVCQCRCGQVITTRATHVLSGRQRSCGCHLREPRIVNNDNHPWRRD